MAPAISLGLVIWVVCGSNDQWLDFRGPTGQGIAREAQDLPVQWSVTQNVKWKSGVPGRGWSTPLVVGDKIWLTTATDEGHSLRAMALSFDSGSVLYDVEVFTPDKPVHLNAKNSHASPSPVSDGERVVVSFGTMGTACLDARTGRVLWSHQEIQLDHKEGPGSSPILWKNKVIMTCDGIDVQYVAALDLETGRVLWKTPRPLPIHPDTDQCKAYTTPLVVQAGGRDELVSPGAQQVLAYDPETGSPLWRIGYQGYSTVPRPLFADGLIYICTGYTKPQLLAIRPGGTGDVTESHVVWKYDRQVPANPSPIYVEGRIYMMNNTGILTCVDGKTGEAIWTKRVGGNFSASPLYADGKIYFASEEGVTTVIAPGDEFTSLGKNELDSGHMASPIAVGKSLFLRSATAVYRFEQ